MLQTLFVFPHWLFQGPLTVAWLVLGFGFILFLYFKKPKQKTGEDADKKIDYRSEAFGFLPVYLIVAAVIHFLLPQFEVTDVYGTKLGLAVRGYGVCLLLAILAGLGVAWIRCQQLRFDFESVLSTAFWMIVCGIAGARIFYLIQKTDIFSSRKPSEWPMLVLDVTEGGLVVYGAVIGGVAALLVIVMIRRLPLMQVADIIAPGMLIGQSIGRIGCLMNGCCFGGACDIEPIAIQFPPGSPPYMRQLETGELLGMKTRPLKVENEEAEDDPNQTTTLEVLTVQPESLAAQLGIQEGERITIYAGRGDYIREIKKNPQADLVHEVNITRSNGVIRIPTNDLPDRGIDTHPTQIYSSLNAAILFLFLWFYFPFRKGHGEVFALMLMLYALTRFLLEAIRVDELGIWGTPFSISQWISFAVLGVGIAVFLIARSRFPIQPGGEDLAASQS